MRWPVGETTANFAWVDITLDLRGCQGFFDPHNSIPQAYPIIPKIGSQGVRNVGYSQNPGDRMFGRENGWLTKFYYCDETINIS